MHAVEFVQHMDRVAAYLHATWTSLFRTPPGLLAFIYMEYIIHCMVEHQAMVDLLDYLNLICIKIPMNQCGLMAQF